MCSFLFPAVYSGYTCGTCSPCQVCVYRVIREPILGSPDVLRGRRHAIAALLRLTVLYGVVGLDGMHGEWRFNWNVVSKNNQISEFHIKSLLKCLEWWYLYRNRQIDRTKQTTKTQSLIMEPNCNGELDCQICFFSKDAIKENVNYEEGDKCSTHSTVDIQFIFMFHILHICNSLVL